MVIQHSSIRVILQYIIIPYLFDLNIFQNIKQKEIIACLVNGVPPRKKYPPSVREFCLQISFLSQRAYKYIRNVFDKHLPGQSTICAWYARTDLSCPAGINIKALRCLEKKVVEMRSMQTELVCSISVDEMSIHHNIQWSKSKKTLMGLATYGDTTDVNDGTVNYAKQAIVFMLCGVNERLQLPFAHHFVTSINGKQRAELLLEVFQAVRETGIDILNITSDGLPANESMCKELGANFNFNSSLYKPFIELEDGHKIFVLKDAPHMMKLVRNALGSKLHFIDADGNDIKWSTIEKLVQFGGSSVYNLTHKLNQRHVQWARNIMKVDIAVQTLSLSTAKSLEILMNERVPGFEMVYGLIRFIRCFNDIFDVLNTKANCPSNTNVFKNALCPQNRRMVFELFEKSIAYIKGLSYVDQEDGNKVKSVLTSKIKTGFKGNVLLSDLQKEFSTIAFFKA